MDTAVNWNYLARSLDAYVVLGYRRVEAPWAIPAEFNKITCQDEGRIFDVKGLGSLVGSSEQSFLFMELTGLITPGRYVTLTPCFRNEKETESHKPYFMKTELYSSVPGVSLRDAEEMLRQTTYVIREICGVEPTPVKTDEGWDLEVNGVEVGSYGLRRHEGHSWAYGTGLAEPRLSYALNLRDTKT